MTSKLKLLTLTSMVALGSASAEAPEVSMSGYFLSGMGGGLDKDFNHLGSASGNEIDLTTSIAFGSATTVDLYTTMNSAWVSGTGDGSSWWPTVLFDGITFTHQFTDDFSLVGGDLIYSAGSFGYYFYKREASVITEDAVRGIGFMASGLTVYTGSGEGDVWKTYAGFDAPTPEGMSFSINAEYTGQIGADQVQAGATFGMEQGMFALNATAGMYQVMGSDLGFGVLVEPFVDMGSFNVLASFFMQDRGESGAAAAADIEDMYFYIEPGFPIDDISSFGVTVEYSDPSSDIEEDEVFSTWPTYYLTPADDVTFLMTVGYIQPLADGADNGYGYGLELQGSF